MKDLSLHARTLRSIQVQCDSRGIGEKVEDVTEIIEDVFDAKVADMDGAQLRSLNRDLPHILVEFLGGQKRIDKNPHGLSPTALAAALAQ